MQNSLTIVHCVLLLDVLVVGVFGCTRTHAREHISCFFYLFIPFRSRTDLDGWLKNVHWIAPMSRANINGFFFRQFMYAYVSCIHFPPSVLLALLFIFYYIGFYSLFRWFCVSQVCMLIMAVACKGCC